MTTPHQVELGAVTAVAAAGLSVMAASSMDTTQVMVAAFGFATAFSTLWFAYITKKMDRKLSETKEQVMKASETAQLAAQTTVEKTDKLVEQTDVIHKLTNSNLAESEKKRAAAEERAESLQTMVDKLLTQAVEIAPAKSKRK